MKLIKIKKLKKSEIKKEKEIEIPKKIEPKQDVSQLFSYKDFGLEEKPKENNENQEKKKEIIIFQGKKIFMRLMKIGRKRKRKGKKKLKK